MLLIWGSRWRKKTQATIQFDCHFCDKKDSQIFSMQRWFTFFFIPIFPTSSKKFYIECLDCENCYKIKDGINVQALLKSHSKVNAE